MNRRNFLRTAGLAVVASGMTRTTASSLQADRRFKKAVKFGMIEEDISIAEKLYLLKELGFDGVEFSSPNDYDTAEVVSAIAETGLPVHGVVDSVHWRKTLGDPDPSVRAEGVAGLEEAIRDARAYGATTALLVPAVVNEQISYAEAYSRSQAEIRKVIPLAKELDIKIAFENVWNRFLLSPLEFARYIDEFETPYVGAYFDVGNVVTYGWPEQWIRTLGHRILKLDIKEYSREKRDREGPFAGFDVKLGDGDCNWPIVVDALEEIGFSGWATAEIPGGDRQRLKEISERMDRILEL
jgi:hexulose-6-phosphate isomerase